MHASQALREPAADMIIHHLHLFERTAQPNLRSLSSLKVFSLKTCHQLMAVLVADETGFVVDDFSAMGKGTQEQSGRGAWVEEMIFGTSWARSSTLSMRRVRSNSGRAHVLFSIVLCLYIVPIVRASSTTSAREEYQQQCALANGISVPGFKV
ncbi:MAG: hypothetical protein M1820_002279 [Bogoriella megaspora]|nr:MAG: hypothetical protein M1820_002279 [Bogoriella megaspora]